MKNYPEALAPLFTAKWAGRAIEYRLDDPLYQAIREYHGDLAEVEAYTTELRRYLDTGRAKHDGNLTTAAVAHAKSTMVDAVIAAYAALRKDSPKALRARIAELETLVARKDAALRRAAQKAAQLGFSLVD